MNPAGSAAPPRRILVVKLSALGDLFHAVPVVHQLREAYGCPIDWVTQPEYAELVRCHRDVAEVIPYPRRGGLRAWADFRRHLRREAYDLALDLQGLAKSGVVLGLARAQRKIAAARSREGAACFAKERPADSGSGPHALDGLQDSLRHLGISPLPPAYPLDFPEGPPLPGTRPRLAIAPRSRWPAKDWPLDKLSAAVRELRRLRPELSVVVLGGPADREAGEVLTAALGEGCWNLCGQTPLLALGAQLREVDCLLCNDSGPMHFAAAVGTPLVALFGPTDPARTGPVGPGAVVLRPPPGPEGYPDLRSYKGTDCSLIARISVGEVVAAVLRQLPQGG